MASLGSAVGLGILWKFPYVLGKNGGGLFLLTYLFCVFIVGLPILIGELMLGRCSERAAIGAYEVLDKKHSKWKVAGYLGVASSFLIMSFYSVIAGWGMSYILLSLQKPHLHHSTQTIDKVFHTLTHSGEIVLFWHGLFTLITASIVVSGVRKGIEKWGKLMTQILLLLLVVLFLYSTTLEKFGEAVQFIFSPNVKTFQLSSFIEALGLAFWTLSIGQGIMISYGSYTKKGENIPLTATIISGAVIIVAILATLVIYPTLFSFSEGKNLQYGPGLIFQTLPALFTKMPGALLLSTTFFILFVFTALTSAIPLVEVVATNLMEWKRWSRQKAVMIVSFSTFVCGIPSALSESDGVFPNWTAVYGKNFFHTIDDFVSIWLIPVGGLISAIFIGHIFSTSLSRESFPPDSKLFILWGPWTFCMKWVVPTTLFLIIMEKSGLFTMTPVYKG